MDSRQRGQVIRDKLARGLLPVDPIPRFWGAAGRGEPCSGCEEIVTDREPLVEGIRPGVVGQLVHFHVECFYLWSHARRRWVKNHGGSSEVAITL